MLPTKCGESKTPGQLALIRPPPVNILECKDRVYAHGKKLKRRGFHVSICVHMLQQGEKKRVVVVVTMKIAEEKKEQNIRSSRAKLQLLCQFQGQD